LRPHGLQLTTLLKSKVEVGVQVVERWVLARLRKRTFTSLAALNAAIAELVIDLNARTTRHLGTSRRALFDSLEAPALKPLPAVPYEYAEWREAGVGLDYHVEVDRHFYSVPSSLLRERVTVRVTAASVEIFHKGKRVAAHARSMASRRHTTVAEHMPSSHRRYAEWTPERLQRQADRIGPNAGALVAVILRDKPHPEQGFRACLGILRLARSYGETRLEAACARAIEIGARSYSSVSSILKNNLDRHAPEPAAEGPTIVHPNIRGAGYYH
jgi:transposase